MPTQRQLLALVIACCFVAPISAFGLSWKHITASDDGLTNFYMEVGSVTSHAGIRHVRLLFDFSQVQQDPDTLIEHRSVVELASIDCRQRSLAPIEATSYAENMGRGRAVTKMVSPQSKPAVAATGSLDERVIGSVCKTH